MLRQMRMILGISILWLPLSVVFDGINSLLLPVQLSGLGEKDTQATVLGLLTFVGLLAGALIQPAAGVLSDRLRPSLGRRGFIGIGVVLILLSLVLLAMFQSLVGLMFAYLAVQVSASITQAGQQGLLPDLVDKKRRGLASGWKGFMDIFGAMIGFIVLGWLLGEGQATWGLGVIGLLLLTAYFIAVILTPEDKPTPNWGPGAAPRLRQAYQIDLKKNTALAWVVLSRFLFLLGVYATGRFLLFFVADRLGLDASQAAEQAGMLLAGLTLISVLASPFTGWLADRIGRISLMTAGAVLASLSAILLIGAETAVQILVFGGLMSIGSAAFAGGSWALLADLVPKDQPARYFGLANFGTAGAVAAAGLFGPLMDAADRILPGSRFPFLFGVSALAFLASALPLRYGVSREVKHVGEGKETQEKESTDDRRLDVLSISADPAVPQENPHPPRRTPRL